MAVAQGPEPYGDGYSVVRGIEAAVPARFGNRSILLTTKEGGLICVAPGDQPEVLAHFAEQAYAATDGLVATGRPGPSAGGVVHSYEEALNALDPDRQLAALPVTGAGVRGTARRAHEGHVLAVDALKLRSQPVGQPVVATDHHLLGGMRLLVGCGG